MLLHINVTKNTLIVITSLGETMKLVALIFIFSSWSLLAATDKEYEELKKRIEDLETQQEQLLMSAAEPKNSVGSFLNDQLTFGGFFDGGYDFITGPDTDTQSTNNSNALGLNLSADLGNKYRFVTQLVNILSVPLLNQHNDPRGSAVGLPDERHHETYTTLSVLTQGYLEYNFSKMFNLQGGLGYVPFGYALQLREPVIYVRRNGPQLVREGANLVSPLWSGFHLYGSKSVGKKEFGYNVYTFTPSRKAHFVGLGARSWMAALDEKFIGGISAQIGRNEDETFKTVGADARFDFHPIQLRTEFSELINKDIDNTWSMYVEPGYWIYHEEVLLYVFGDYLYGANNETGFGSSALADPIQKWEYGAGVNWLPTSFTRLRLGFTFNDYIGSNANPQGQNRDYFGLDISAGIAF
jgi:hypothetical protein